MDKRVVKVWTFRGNLRGSVQDRYETIRYADGTLSCDCRGWCRCADEDGNRTCKHTRMVEQGVADKRAMTVRVPTRE